MKALSQKDQKRRNLFKQTERKRLILKTLLYNNPDISTEEKFLLQWKLDSLARNGARARIKNRCVVTSRGRSVYRKFKISRLEFQKLAGLGQIPGVTKSSW